jgi:hypothetical protein
MCGPAQKQSFRIRAAISPVPATTSRRPAERPGVKPVRRRESSGRKAADATHLPYAWTPRRRRRCGKTDSYASMPTRSMRPARFPRSLSPTRRFAPRYRVGDDPLIKNGLTWRVEGCLPSGRRARAERWEVVDRVGRTRGAPGGSTRLGQRIQWRAHAICRYQRPADSLR